MLLEIWQAAVDAEVGVSVPTDNRQLLRQHLYRARAEANNPEFDDIVIILPANETEIWLVHKDADSGGADNEGDFKPLYP
jgi:DNA-binding phage protein